MAALSFVPLLAMLTILAATLVRGFAIRRATGDRTLAFTSAKGIQRVAGSSFVLSIAALFAAAALAPAGMAMSLSAFAAIVALAGAVIVIVAQFQMGRAWRIGVRAGDAPRFISHGLFRFSRNPIFVGMMLVGLATAMVSGTWWSWAAVALFAASCALQVRIEEVHLEANFGETYRAFRRRVPRWFGLAREA